ncbi:hypothetical protein [Vibrio owensii]|uniref:hypothetical protein n=1 Tax=Vibrio owensii TaxID=696485 RepID=UPI003CC62596
MIKASVNTDDHIESVTIDVTPYFEFLIRQSDFGKTIEKLDEGHWMSSDAADEVIYFIRDQADLSNSSKNELQVIFDHIKTEASKGNDVGFECIINHNLYLEWQAKQEAVSCKSHQKQSD